MDAFGIAVKDVSIYLFCFVEILDSLLMYIMNWELGFMHSIIFALLFTDEHA